MFFFARADDGFDTGLHPGSEVDADLHFHPGQPRLRAVVEARYAESRQMDGRGTVGNGIAITVARLHEVVAIDPWCGAWPVATHGSLA